MKLLLIDLDGTLFDTREVNYLSYKEALGLYGYELDHEYYRNFCNGRFYMDFLPQITTTDKAILKAIHEEKKKVYKKYLDVATMNVQLVDLIRVLRSAYKVALVTTASRENTMDILSVFNISNLFDLILTGDQIEHAKPHPEGYLKAMDHFGVSPDNAVVFEDSDIGIEAAKNAGVQCFIVNEYDTQR